MNDRFEPQALAELIHAMNYLDGRVAGLGNQFYDEVNEAIKLIKEQPDRWPALTKNVHRYRLKRFSYYVIYQIRNDGVLITAVMHTHQRPGYWQGRL